MSLQQHYNTGKAALSDGNGNGDYGKGSKPAGKASFRGGNGNYRIGMAAARPETVPMAPGMTVLGSGLGLYSIGKK
jgi:hypothetical protein